MSDALSSSLKSSNWGQHWRYRLLQMFLPLQCPACYCLVDTRGLCGKCWGQIHFLGSTSCSTCAFPLPLTPSDEENVQCGACLTTPPPFTRAFSTCVYDGPVRTLVLRYKHGKELWLTPLLTQWLVATGDSLWHKADVIVPVPLHWTRLVSRTFNQAALLTNGISKKTGVRAACQLLKRTRRTSSQGHFSVKERHDNVRGAFRVSERFLPVLQGARVVLVDDVYTTGATLTECARVLLEGGAREVSVLCMARVI